MTQTTKRFRLSIHGVTRGQWEDAIARGQRWCSKGKHFADAASFAGPTQNYCKPCYNAYYNALYHKNLGHSRALARNRYKKNPAKFRRLAKEARAKLPRAELQRRRFVERLKYRFKITVAQYDELLQQQDGHCALCDKTPNGKALSVDHDHSCCPGRITCGKCIRGLLCEDCNFLIGKIEAHRERIPRLLEYLKRSN